MYAGTDIKKGLIMLDWSSTVMSLDDDSNEEWLHSKLQLWKRNGYDIEIIEEKIGSSPENSIEIISKYDSLFERGEDVRNRMRELPRNLEMKRHSLVEKLRTLDEVPYVENIVRELLEEFRPWALIVEKNISSWKMHGKLDKLNELVGRLNNLDPSMIIDAKSIAQYFVDPRMKDRIENEIVEIESRQNERSNALTEMEDLLDGEGFQIKELGNLNLEKRFEEISNVQQEQKKHLKLKHKINQGVRIFDSDLANDFENRRVELLNSDTPDNFIQLSNEVEESSNMFFGRLDTINKKIRNWREMGIEFENMGSISAKELYEWENTISEKQERVDLLLELRKRLIKQNEIWGDEIDNMLLGIRRIDLIDKLEDAVESLENKTHLLNIEFDGFIDSWKKRGYNMQKWVGRYNRNPRETLAELKAFRPVLEEGEILRKRIEKLDEDILNSKRKMELYSTLEDSDIELDTLIEIDLKVRVLEKREINYKEKLVFEWESLVRDNVASRRLDTTQWNITEFESYISKAINEDLGEIPTSKTRVMSSLQKSLENEFSVMEKQGWNMSGLYSLLEKSPEKLGNDLPSIRKQILQFDRLVKRLEVLPWERDQDKARKIISQLKMPEKLPKIWDNIPSIIRELSKLDAVTEKFEFIPWKPIIIPLEKEHGRAHNESKRITSNVKKNTSKPVKNLSKTKERKGDGSAVKFNAKFWNEYSVELEKFSDVVGIKINVWPIQDNDGIKLWRRTLAENVGYIPRDTRVDRMLRLALRCLPSEDDIDVPLNEYLNLIKSLSKSAKNIHKWTKIRLDYRNTMGSDSLLNDVKKLGNMLERIPGPGVKLPLAKDEYTLPQSNNLVGLKNECQSLLKMCFVM